MAAVHDPPAQALPSSPALLCTAARLTVLEAELATLRGPGAGAPKVGPAAAIAAGSGADEVVLNMLAFDQANPGKVRGKLCAGACPLGLSGGEAGLHATPLLRLNHSTLTRAPPHSWLVQITPEVVLAAAAFLRDKGELPPSMTVGRWPDKRAVGARKGGRGGEGRSQEGRTAIAWDCVSQCWHGFRLRLRGRACFPGVHMGQR